MTKPATTIVRRVSAGGEDSYTARRRTAVSLHGHTLHSHERMMFIPRIASAIPPLKAAIDVAAWLRGSAGMDGVDWSRLYWTPPLAPREAFDLEANQLRALGFEPLVSLTDHDDISAPMHLSALRELTGQVPVSVEWTFPFRGTYFHLGIHNLPAGGAREIWSGLAEATELGGEPQLLNRLAEIALLDGTLTVLNHPFWDEKGVGHERHRASLTALLTAAGPAIDALEWNGFRPPAENRLAMQCAADKDMPVVAGGDRHGLEPNSCLNLTSAATFAEFAAEVRHGRHSEILLLPHHFERGALRVIHHMWEILRDDPDHGLGWRRWDERIFFRDKQGVVRPLRAYWGERPPALVWTFVKLVHLMGHAPIRHVVRATLSLGQQESRP